MLKKNTSASATSPFLYLYLSAFSLSLAFLPNTVLLHMLQKPVNPIISGGFVLLGYLLFALLLTLYLQRTPRKALQPSPKEALQPSPEAAPVDDTAVAAEATAVAVEATTRPRLPRDASMSLLKGLLPMSLSVLLLYLMTLVFALAARFALPTLSTLISLDQKSLLWLGLWAMGIVLLLLCLFSGITLIVATAEYRLRLSDLGRAYGLIVLRMLTGLYKALPYSLFAGLALYGANALQNLQLMGLETILLPGFYRNFVFYTFGALLNAGLFWMIITLARDLLKSLTAKLGVLSSREAHRKVPVFAAIVLVGCIASTLVIAPIGKDATDGILAEVALHENKGDALLNMGLSLGAIYEYDMAYSKLLSLKGYLQGLRYFLDPTNNAADLSAAEQSLAAAATQAPRNPYVPYFRGLLYLKNNNPDGAIAALQQAVANQNGVVYSYFSLIEAYRIKAQPQLVQQSLQILENTETYENPYEALGAYKLKKIDGLIDKLNTLESRIGPKRVTKAVEKANLGDSGGALSELMALQTQYPKDLQINYQIAKLANDYRDEQNNYAKVIQYAGLFDQLSEQSGAQNDDATPERKLFVAQMYMGANALDQALMLLQDAVKLYPSHTELGLQYAYALTQANRPEEALKALDGLTLGPAAGAEAPGNAQLEATKDAQLEALYLRALSHLLMKDAAQSLASMSEFTALAEKNGRLDKSLYNYCIVFYKTFPGTEADGQVAALKSQPLLSAYLAAVKGWKDKDSEASNKALEQVLKLRADLGYAYYMMGVNYYESTVRKGETDFSKAAAYYQESLKYLPQHAEGYFALGHCYLKWGKNLEALRAFRKVVDLMPYEDHRVDPYGITVHAIMQVNALLQYDVKEAQ